MVLEPVDEVSLDVEFIPKAATLVGGVGAAIGGGGAVVGDGGEGGVFWGGGEGGGVAGGAPVVLDRRTHCCPWELGEESEELGGLHHAG